MKRIIKSLIIIAVAFLFCALSACNQEKVYSPSRTIAVTLLNGQHYTVLGDNKRLTEKGGTVTFQIDLENGYRATSYIGDKCDISENISFSQTVTFNNVKYNMTAQVQTEELPVYEFEVIYDETMGFINIASMLESAGNGMYYDSDILSLVAMPETDKKFVCWSIGGYLANGGNIYSYEPIIENVDFVGIKTLYANFTNVIPEKALVYRIDDLEIEQDCSLQMVNQYRANTYTAVDIRNLGIDCDSRMLVGWTNGSGEITGLGSRIAIEDEEVVLYPVWKDYTASEYFSVEDGVLTGFSGTADDEGAVVIPNEVGGQKIISIGANAFENCSAEIYYIPDTVETVADNAFLNCVNLKELYMSDNIISITDNAFSGCRNFETLHINAYLKPRYSKEQEAVISSVYDRLALNADSGTRKVVVLGGSGVQAGYSCSVISEMFEEAGENVDVYNFGWSAAYCGFAQFEVINSYLREDDIFIHAPEHYYGALCGYTGISPLTGEECIALSDGISFVYRLSESNWDFTTNLTVNEYSNLFSKFTVFNEYRNYMPERDYSDFCDWAVEDGYGYRLTNEQVFYENGTDKSFGGELDIVPFASRFELIKNYMYSKIDEGVIVYVTFPAVNRANLLLTYGDEESVKDAAEEYTRQVTEILSDMNLQILLTQYDTVYDGRYFYNHDYHLGYPTRDAHTEKVITALIEKFQMREVNS